MLYTLRFFSSKCSLFHNANFFGSCIIRILYTGCAKIKKNNSGAKGLNEKSTISCPYFAPHTVTYELHYNTTLSRGLWPTVLQISSPIVAYRLQPCATPSISVTVTQHSHFESGHSTRNHTHNVGSCTGCGRFELKSQL